MHFCILSPIAGLERYSSLSNHHLVLPQLAKNQTYLRYYQEKKHNGEHIILDNGAWEGKLNNKELLESIKLFDPNVVVLPDFLLQSWEKTLQSATEFLDRYYYEFPSVGWAFCPQAVKGDIMGWLEGLVRALQDQRISWVCLPRALATDISQDPLIRANCCRFLKRKGKRVHALGMLSGNTGELAFLRDAGCDSVDSNAPVWRGWNGVRLGQPWRRNRPIDYNESGIGYTPSVDSPIDQIILDNLEACGVNTISVRPGDGIERSYRVGSSSY